MSYNTALKMKSPMKTTINTFIGQCSTPESIALVIDADSMLSSSALVSHGVIPNNVIVLNSDNDIIKKAHEHGHTRSVAGFSTNVLDSFVDTFDIIYLDYCGTPDGNKSDGVLPKYDMLWAADRLSDDGIVIVTFSRRNHEGHAVERAQKMIPLSMDLLNVVYYCETSPMFAMMLVKKGLNSKRNLRDKFNRIKMEIHDQINKTPKLTKKRKCDADDVVEKRQKVHEDLILPDLVEKHSTEAYNKRMESLSPERYSIIGYYYDNTLWKGVVEEVHKDGRIKILWVDEKDKYDYGSCRGYYVAGTHIHIDSPNHNKNNGNWCYLYDTYETKTAEEIDELEDLPISLSRKNYLALKKRFIESMQTKTYMGILQYFGINE